MVNSTNALGWSMSARPPRKRGSVASGSATSNDRPTSSAGSTAFSSAPQDYGAGIPAQGWANNGQSSMIPRELATLFGVPGSSEDVPQHAAPNRGLVPGHGEPTFAPTFAPQAGQHPLSQFHQPQGNWGQQWLSRDSVGPPQVNVGVYNQIPTGVGYHSGGFAERAGSGPNVNNYPYGAFQTTGYPMDLPQSQTKCRKVDEYKRTKPQHEWDLEVCCRLPPPPLPLQFCLSCVLTTMGLGPF